MRYLFLIIFILPFFLFARGKVVYKQTEENIEPPWLTGPLIAPAGRVVPLGHYNIEPYFFATAYGGMYGSDWEVVESPTFWNNYFQIPVQIGLASWLDFQFIPTVNWNYTQHQAAWVLGDMPVGFDVQLYTARQNSWAPSAKLSLKANLPIGKYRNLDPKKLSTDDGGSGSWATGLGVVLSNLYHFRTVYYLNYRLALNYTLPVPVRLKGFNFYGGGYGTDLRFFPPQNFQADLGLEITLAQTWALALDVIGFWAGKGHSSGGDFGIDKLGNPARINRRWLRSQVQYSLAPAIEYNWNENLGIIAGAWFTVAGRYTRTFTSGVLALNYYK